MISIDTNVLLRRLLNDDADQTAKARTLFSDADAILVTDVVLVETIGTLRGKRYKAFKDDIVAVVMGLLEEPNVVFESQQAVWSALNDYIDAQAFEMLGRHANRRLLGCANCCENHCHNVSVGYAL